MEIVSIEDVTPLPPMRINICRRWYEYDHPSPLGPRDCGFPRCDFEWTGPGSSQGSLIHGLGRYFMPLGVYLRRNSLISAIVDPVSRDVVAEIGRSR